MAPTNSQPTEAATKSTPITAADFDKNLVEWIDQYFKPIDPLIKALDHIRVHYELNLIQGIKHWPKESIYCSTDAILNLYNLLSQRGLLGAEHQNLQQELAQMSEADDANIERMLYLPSLVSVLQPWNKERCIFHVKNQEFPDDILDAKTSIVSNMPQWAMCFNLADQNFLWDNERVCGIIFARYFIGADEQTDGIPPEEFAKLKMQCIEGEPPAVIDNLISVVFFEDGRFDLGPYVPVSNDLTFNQFLSNISQDLIKAAKKQQDEISDEDIANIKAMSEGTNTRAAILFKYLVHTLQHPELYKDKDGKACTAPEHPKVVRLKEGVQFLSAIDVTHIMVD